MSGKIDIDSLSKKELQRILASEGESKTGNKATLVDRLRTCLEAKSDDDDGADYDDGTGFDDDDDVTSPKTRFEKEAAPFAKDSMTLPRKRVVNKRRFSEIFSAYVCSLGKMSTVDLIPSAVTNGGSTQMIVHLLGTDH